MVCGCRVPLGCEVEASLGFFLCLLLGEAFTSCRLASTLSLPPRTLFPQHPGQAGGDSMLPRELLQVGTFRLPPPKQGPPLVGPLRYLVTTCLSFPVCQTER